MNIPTRKYGLGTLTKFDEVDFSVLNHQTKESHLNIPEGVIVEPSTKPTNISSDPLTNLHNQYANQTTITIPNTDQEFKISGYTRSAPEHITIHLKPGAKATIQLIAYNYNEASTFGLEINQAQDSTCKVVILQHGEQDGFFFHTKTASLAKGAKLDWTNIILGSNKTVDETAITLEGEHASTNLSLLAIGNNTQHLDVGATITHTAPNTKSQIKSSNILQDKARLIGRYLIDVKQQAKGSIANQTDKTILMANTARVDPIPSLVVDTDDVQAAHGSAVSTLDEEALFYLESRGLSPQQAREEILKGMIHQITNLFKDQQIKDKIELKLGELLYETPLPHL